MVTELIALRADELAALEIFHGCPAEDLMPLAARVLIGPAEMELTRIAFLPRSSAI